MKKIFLISRYNKINPVIEALQYVSNELDISFSRIDYLKTEDFIIPTLFSEIKKSDIVVADISEYNPNILYEIGIAHGLKKPVILVAKSKTHIPFSLLSFNIIVYNENENGIKNLAFQFKEVISNSNILKELNPLTKPSKHYDYNRFEDNERLSDILNFSGKQKYLLFENWAFELFNNIKGLEVSKSENFKGKEYDFIIWNSVPELEFEKLGNPIPVEIKATKTLSNNLIHTLANKASLQGFKSVILITTAHLTERNHSLISEIKEKNNILISVLDIEALSGIEQPKDLVWEIKKSIRKLIF